MSTHGTDRRRLRNDLKELAKLAGELQQQPPASSQPAIAATSLVEDAEEIHELETEVLTPATARMPPSARFSVPPVSVPAIAASLPPQPVAMSVAPMAEPKRAGGVGRAVAIGATAGLLISALGIGGMVLMKRGQAASNEPSGASAIQVAAQPVSRGDAPVAAKPQPDPKPAANVAPAPKPAAAPKDDAFSVDDLPQAKKASAPTWYAAHGHAAPSRPAAVAAPKAAAPEPPKEAAKADPAPEEKPAPEPKTAKAPEPKPAPEPKAAEAKPAPAAGGDTPSSNPLLDEIRAAVKKESGKK